MQIKNSDPDDRTTPIGLFNQAHSYAESAKVLLLNPINLGLRDGPIRFLYGHAIELYLKSFLLLNKVSIKELSSKKYGHDTKLLLEKAIEFGLQTDATQKLQIENASNVIPDRYLETGAYTLLTPSVLHALCIHLNKEIGQPVFDDFGTTRKPPEFR